MNGTGSVSILKAACTVATETILNSPFFPMSAKPDLSLPPLTRATRLFSATALLLVRDRSGKVARIHVIER
jgi:hypothetical protein